MSQEDFFNLLNLSSLHKRIYAALVRKASLLSAEILKNKISLIAVMEGADPKDYHFSSLLDALSLKISPDEFEAFLAEF